MKPPRCAIPVLLAFMFAMPLSATAQPPGNPAALITAQREALARLAFLDGVWRGPAWTILPSGEKHTVTQTERVGSLLSGSVRVIEGRGYEADHTVAFNAFAVLSYDVNKAAFTMRSYAQGRAGDFALTPTADGFSWEIPAGPATIRYTAIVKDGTWRETGDRLMPGQEPVRFFEMELVRVGDTGWPGEGAPGPE
jgi:hypothetical protein